MNVFQAVKYAVSTRQAAQAYGISVNRRGMAVCPFHNDKNPSMKVDNRFHCFGCQADGDVIDFVSGLFNMSAVDAALKLAQDFGISYEYERGAPSRAAPQNTVKLHIANHTEDELKKHFVIITNYLHCAKTWAEQFAPKTPDEKWHSLFEMALDSRTYLEYLADELLDCKDRAPEALIKICTEEEDKFERKYRQIIAGGEIALSGGIESTGSCRAKSA
jgi:hypothetical protein